MHRALCIGALLSMEGQLEYYAFCMHFYTGPYALGLYFLWRVNWNIMHFVCIFTRGPMHWGCMHLYAFLHGALCIGALLSMEGQLEYYAFCMHFYTGPYALGLYAFVCIFTRGPMHWGSTFYGGSTGILCILYAFLHGA